MAKMKKIITLLLAILMVMGTLTVGVSAAESNTSKTAEWADATNTVANVTLAVPGDVEIKGADIVFVVDKSSCGALATNELKVMFEELAAAQAQSGAKIKVGVVVFNYTDHTDIPLTELTAENYEKLLEDLKEYNGGTNIEAGLQTAHKMLADDDDDVPDENKYVILISDGLTWVFDDENGDPQTILWLNGDTPLAGTTAHQSIRKLKNVEIPADHNWDTYWEQIKTWVEADGDQYEYSMIGYGTADWSSKTEEAKKVALSTEEGQSHATNMERAMYDAWLAYTALQDAGYKCYVNNVTSSYIGGIGDQFMNMLGGGEDLDFESIQNSIIHSVSSGSTVVDYMGYSDDADEGYNFDFITDPDTMVLTVGGAAYTTTQLETAKKDFDASYSFAKDADSDPTFWLDYVKGNGTTEEKFIWTFGEDVSAFYPATLDYQVELTAKKSAADVQKYIVETNQSATLYPVDTQGTPGTSEVFPVPELVVPKYKVTYEYTGTVPTAAPELPATRYYFPGDLVTIEADENYKVTDYIFSGWQDPCEYLSEGIMPAHDVTLTGYYLPVNVNVDPPIGIKTDKETTGNDYEVKIEVPGDGDAVKIHDEVILIIDGSYSMDEEWEAMKTNIVEIGNHVLGGAGRTQMTVISFGMGDNIVVEGIKTVAELEAMLPELPGGLLYGRSSTNCEVGFTAALNYIESKQDELAKVDVIFISDGGINTDETPRAFDTNWQEFSTRLGADVVAVETLYGAITSGENLPEAYAEVFGSMATEDALKATEKHTAFVNEVWANVYDYSDLTLGKEYPISVVERAFVKYDKENGTYVQDAFYCSTYKSSHVTYPNMADRTVKAANALAASSLVDELYLLRYADHGNGWWVKDIEDGKNYYKAENVAGLLNNVGSMLTELSNTNYKDVVITDYMSKWVLLHPDSIRIVNDTTGKTIWSAKDGWAADAEKPTTAEPPVRVELVKAEDYAAGGTDVIGNTSGDIYKITWHVKDDCLLRTDNYSLRYTVTVDTKEEGLELGKEYPANGDTYVEFKDSEDKTVRYPIDVPNVTVPAYTVTYINGKTVLQETGDLMTGDDITQYAGETPKKDAGAYTIYTFAGWKLIEGTPVDDKIGTTDLVYEAQFRTITIDKDEINNDIVDIPDDIPLAPVPEVFTDDHFAYIVGYPDGSVQPGGQITRAEVATIFFRLLDEDVRSSFMCSENEFSDVNPGNWFNNAVSTMAAMGIVNGYPDGSFKPNAPITRAEFAVIAARFDLEASDEGRYFSDVVDHWAEREISMAVNNGWIKGYDDGTFRPNQNITRAEAMTLVNRVLHRLPETPEDLLDDMIKWPDNANTEAWYYLAVQEATNSHLYSRETEESEFETWLEMREARDWTELEY